MQLLQLLQRLNLAERLFGGPTYLAMKAPSQQGLIDLD